MPEACADLHLCYLLQVAHLRARQKKKGTRSLQVNVRPAIGTQIAKVQHKYTRSLCHNAAGAEWLRIKNVGGPFPQAECEGPESAGQKLLLNPCMLCALQSYTLGAASIQSELRRAALRGGLRTAFYCPCGSQQNCDEDLKGPCNRVVQQCDSCSEGPFLLFQGRKWLLTSESIVFPQNPNHPWPT